MYVCIYRHTVIDRSALKPRRDLKNLLLKLFTIILAILEYFC